VGGNDSGTWLDDDATEGGAPDRETTGAAGRYDLHGEVARGGLGRILRATDTSLDREVAIKTMLRHSPGAEARFDREMRLTARLQHPNIVPVFDGGRLPGGHPYLAMRLVHGRSLSEAIAAAQGLGERLKLLPHIVDACNAIAYAHDQRVLHRDLKPDNVLVGAFGETVVIDWGLAKDLDDESTDEVAASSGRPVTSGGSGSLTVVGSVMGTPAYMPPEQARGEVIDARADVYALGAMLYELLAGEKPYAGSNNTLKAALAGPPVGLRVQAPEAPRDLVSVAERAMARLPQDRYRDAAALAADLARFQEGRLVTAYHYSPTEQVVRWVRQRPLVTALLATMVLGVGISVLLLNRSREVAEGARAVAEEERAAALALEAQAVRREDALRIEQARGLTQIDPNAAVLLLEGLSQGHVFDGTVRTIFSAAMAEGLRSTIPGVSREDGALAVSGDWLAIAQPDSLWLGGTDLVERATLPFPGGTLAGVVRMGADGRFAAVTEEGIVPIVAGQVQPVLPGLGYKISRARSAAELLVSRRSSPVLLNDGVATSWPEAGPRSLGMAGAQDALVFDRDAAGAWLRDGSVVATGSWCSRSLWAGAFSGERVFVVGGFSGVCILELVNGTVREQRRPMQGFKWMDTVAAAPDGGAWLGGDRREVVRVDASGEVLERVALAGLPEAIVEADGGVLITSDAGDVVLAGRPGQAPTRWRVNGPARSAALLPDGAVAVSVGDDVIILPARTVDVVAHTQSNRFHVDSDGGLFLPDQGVWGRWCGAVWAIQGPALYRDGALVHTFDEDVYDVNCAETGDVAAVTDYSVGVFDREDGALLTLRTATDGIELIGAGLADSGGVVVGRNRAVEIWRWRDGVWTDFAIESISDFTETHDAEILYATTTGELHESGRQETARLGWVPSSSARHGKRVAFGGELGELEVYEGLKRVGTAPRGHTQYVVTLAFDPSGRMLASAGYDETVWLWDTSVEPMAGRPLHGHASAVRRTEWDQQGRLYSVDEQGVLARWTDPWPTDPVALRRAVHATALAIQAGGPTPLPEPFE
jgi:hypothetical protein